MEQRNIDVGVNLGDILYGPIAPRATYDLLMEKQFVTISGNQDRQIYQSTATEISANPTLQFILDQLGQEPLSWLKSLPFDKQLTPEVYLCHGTPHSDLIYLLEDIDSGPAQLRSDQGISDLLNGQDSELILCGHSHSPRTVSTRKGQLIVNPGSVGLAAYTDDEPVRHSMENYSGHASYAIVENSAADWNVEQIKVSYDVQKSTQLAKQNNRLDWVHFLNTGRQQQH
jgi:predicted phosphodiesterase